MATLDELIREAERLKPTRAQLRAVTDPLDVDPIDSATFALMTARMHLRRAIARIERRDVDGAQRLVSAAARSLQNHPRAEALDREVDQRRTEKLRVSIAERVA